MSKLKARGFANEKPELDVTIANLERQLNDAYFQRYLLVHQRRGL